MSGYDNPVTLRHDLGVFDFGAAVGARTHPIKGPAGKQGIIRAVGADVVEATVFATTLGNIKVGVSGTLAKNVSLDIPTATSAGTTVAATITDEAITADTQVLITLTEGAGASLAGQAAPYLVIDWF